MKFPFTDPNKFANWFEKRISLWRHFRLSLGKN